MFHFRTCVLLLATIVAGPSCRKQEVAAPAAGPAPVVAPVLEDNRMDGAPEGLLRSRAGSPVHWQHWDPEVLTHAGEARRLIFAFIGSTQYPGCIEALDMIDGDPALIARLNGEFVPVLVDTDLCREAGIAAGFLSQEIQLPVGFPFILILTPDGNEVTWRPLHFTTAESLQSTFEASADVVAKMWQESPDYVERNSTKDHANRLNRLPKPDRLPTGEGDRGEFLAMAARQLVSLYDPDIGTLSGTGGLMPLGILQCLASASLDPGLSPEIAGRCRQAVAGFAANVLDSAMVDPLDGGVYASRRGRSWNLPVNIRTCMTQARTARALITLHAATGDPRALEVALGAVRFAEDQFSAQDGLFSNQRQPVTAPITEGLWTRDQIQELLTPREAALWIARSEINDLGNLTDAGGDFFRLNSLGFRISLEEASAAAGIDAAEAPAILESGRVKLLAARQRRTPDALPADGASAAPSFRMISAYAALFTATGDASWRDKAIALADRSREVFSQGDLLVERNPAVPASVCDARAFTYALAIQAALDLAEITLDEKWRIWAGDLATTSAEHFVTADGHLLEARPASTPLQIPIEDRIMLFDDSTAGVMRMNLARLDALRQPPPPSIAPWTKSLPPIKNFPVVFTDSILATSFARSRVILDLPASASPAWRDAVTRLPLDRIARRIGTVDEVTARRPDGSTVVIKDPAGLAEVFQAASL